MLIREDVWQKLSGDSRLRGAFGTEGIDFFKLTGYWKDYVQVNIFPAVLKSVPIYRNPTKTWLPVGTYPLSPDNNLGGLIKEQMPFINKNITKLRYELHRNDVDVHILRYVESGKIYNIPMISSAYFIEPNQGISRKEVITQLIDDLRKSKILSFSCHDQHRAFVFYAFSISSNEAITMHTNAFGDLMNREQTRDDIHKSLWNCILQSKREEFQKWWIAALRVYNDSSLSVPQYKKFNITVPMTQAAQSANSSSSHSAASTHTVQAMSDVPKELQGFCTNGSVRMHDTTYFAFKHRVNVEENPYKQSRPNAVDRAYFDHENIYFTHTPTPAMLMSMSTWNKISNDTKIHEGAFGNNGTDYQYLSAHWVKVTKFPYDLKFVNIYSLPQMWLSVGTYALSWDDYSLKAGNLTTRIRFIDNDFEKLRYPSYDVDVHVLKKNSNSGFVCIPMISIMYFTSSFNYAHVTPGEKDRLRVMITRLEAECTIRSFSCHMSHHAFVFFGQYIDGKVEVMQARHVKDKTLDFNDKNPNLVKEIPDFASIINDWSSSGRNRATTFGNILREAATTGKKTELDKWLNRVGQVYTDHIHKLLL